MKTLLGCAALCLLSGAALAGPAADTVRAFYLPQVQSATDAESRDRFVDPARSQLDKNDATAEAGEGVGCIDWDLAADGQDFEDAAIARTLKLSEKVSGERAVVTARFRQFSGAGGGTTTVEWTLRKVGGAWKVADIASLSGNWRLSSLDCD